MRNKHWLSGASGNLAIINTNGKNSCDIRWKHFAEQNVISYFFVRVLATGPTVVVVVFILQFSDEDDPLHRRHGTP